WRMRLKTGCLAMAATRPLISPNTMMPIVAKANAQISAKPKREPLWAAKTSSLMSTKPPTAVMIPSVISISRPTGTGHDEKTLRDRAERGRVLMIERRHGLCDGSVQRCAFAAGALVEVVELVDGIFGHGARVNRVDAAFRLKTKDLSRFRRQRAHGAHFDEIAAFGGGKRSRPKPWYQWKKQDRGGLAHEMTIKNCTYLTADA